MAKVEVIVPDELLGRARAAGLDVSQLASAAVAEELVRLAKIAALDAYLADLDRTLDPSEFASRRFEAASDIWICCLPRSHERPLPSRSRRGALDIHDSEWCRDWIDLRQIAGGASPMPSEVA